MAWLRDIFAECAASRSAAVVALRSPTGWGKTTEVMQCYEDLAAEQRGARFWPAHIADPSRKMVYPQQVQPDWGARLPYLWLGLRADLDYGRPRFAGYDLRGQLDALVEPLAAAAEADAHWWRDVALRLLRAATSQTAVTILPVGALVRELKNLSDIVTELVEMVPNLLEQSRRKGLRTQRALAAGGGRTLITDGMDLDRTYAELAGRALATVSRVVPTIIVVEDAQLLDDHTVAMLRTCMHEQDPAGLLVVLMIATDRLGSGQQWRAWLDELERSKQLAIHDLEPYSASELQDLAVGWLRDKLPGRPIDAALLAELTIGSGGNPLTLGGLLDGPSVIDGLLTGNKAPIAAAIKDAPAADAGLTVTLEGLPIDVRRTLAAAAACGTVMMRSWFDAAVSQLGLPKIGTAAGFAATTDTGWIRAGRGEVVMFVDGANYRAARTAPGVLTDIEQRRICDVVVATVLAARGGSMWLDAPAEARQAGLELALTRCSDTDMQAELGLELDDLYAATGQHQRRVDLLTQLQGQLTHVSRVVKGRLVIMLASAYLELRRNRDAIDILRDELNQVRRDDGVDAETTLVAEHNLAATLQAAGWLDEAIDTYLPVLDRRLTTLPQHHRHIRETRRDLAAAYTEHGRSSEARRVLQDLQSDNLIALGRQHPDTLTDDMSLYLAMIDAGDPESAIIGFTELIPVMASVFPQWDLHILRARRGHGGALLAQGSLNEAEAILKALATDHYLALGPDHPDTLATRASLAAWQAMAGDAAGAVEVFEQLLADQLRVLGPDHPDTLTVRSNLARWRGEAGDVAGAVAAFEQLLTDRLRVIGPDHPHTLGTRVNLAFWRGQAGDVAGAVAAFEQLLADQLRVLGADHPDTLGTRANLAVWRGQAGDMTGTIAELEQLLADRLRVLGPDHPDTLGTRSLLGFRRGQAGDIAGAVAELELLLADQLRMLGADHADTLTGRGVLAFWRGQAGDVAGAVAAFEQLLADRLRVLGPDHRDTLATRKNLASLNRAGESGNAVC